METSNFGFGGGVQGVKAGAGLPFSTIRASRTPKGSDTVRALKHDGGFAVIGGTLPFAEAAFLGYADGGGVIGMDEADGARIGEAGVSPGEDGGDGFGGVAFAVHGGGENPAGFAKVFDGRNEFAMEIGEADFTGKGGGGFFLQDPEAETQERPVSGVAEEFHPGFFFGERAAADELGNSRVGPHRATSGEIFQAMVAEKQARGFNDGKFRGRCKRFEHKKILAQVEYWKRAEACPPKLQRRRERRLEGELAKR